MENNRNTMCHTVKLIALPAYLWLILQSANAFGQSAYAGGSGDGSASTSLFNQRILLTPKSLPTSTIKLFPNPIQPNEQLTLTFDNQHISTLEKATQFDLLTSDGKFLQTLTPAHQTNHQFRFLLPSLPTGTYILQISTPTQNFTFSFICQNL